MHTAGPTATSGGEVWRATGLERPVFLDERGRRRRWVFVGGALTGGASALWLGGLIVGAIGFSNLPLTHATLAARPSRAPVAADRIADAGTARARLRARAPRAPSRSGPQPVRVAAATPGRFVLDQRS
ncbi:MAG: hypothetical protein ACRDK4_09270 [Solirubrobacteraceae bacterium]